MMILSKIWEKSLGKTMTQNTTKNDKREQSTQNSTKLNALKIYLAGENIFRIPPAPPATDNWVSP
jgi:hypothetical protein